MPLNRRALLKGFAATTAGILVPKGIIEAAAPPELVIGEEAMRRFWALDRTMSVPAMVSLGPHAVWSSVESRDPPWPPQRYRQVLTEQRFVTNQIVDILGEPWRVAEPSTPWGSSKSTYKTLVIH